MSAEGGQEVLEAKARLRAEMRVRVRALGAERVAEGSAGVAVQVRRAEGWMAARWVAGFVPLPGEVDVTPLLREALGRGAGVALPSYDAASGAYLFREVRDWEADLEPGRFGIREPREGCGVVPMRRLDFVLVPGLAFDARGGRLGRGRGFYDRLLVSVMGTTCGVCLDEQMVPGVPVENHDIRVKLVATPRGLHGPGVLE